MGQLELPQLVAIFLLVLLLGAVQPKQPLDTTALKGWQGEHHVAVSACHRATSWATMRRGLLHRVWFTPGFTYDQCECMIFHAPLMR